MKDIKYIYLLRHQMETKRHSDRNKVIDVEAELPMNVSMLKIISTLMLSVTCSSIDCNGVWSSEVGAMWVNMSQCDPSASSTTCQSLPIVNLTIAECENSMRSSTFSLHDDVESDERDLHTEHCSIDVNLKKQVRFTPDLFKIKSVENSRNYAQHSFKTTHKPESFNNNS